MFCRRNNRVHSFSWGSTTLQFHLSSISYQGHKYKKTSVVVQRRLTIKTRTKKTNTNIHKVEVVIFFLSEFWFNLWNKERRKNGGVKTLQHFFGPLLNCLHGSFSDTVNRAYNTLDYRYNDYVDEYVKTIILVSFKPPSVHPEDP